MLMYCVNVPGTLALAVVNPVVATLEAVGVRITLSVAQRDFSPLLVMV